MSSDLLNILKLLITMLFFFITAIFPSILTIVSSENNKCALWNDPCNPTIAEPCCDRYDNCKKIGSLQFFRCIKKTGLGKLCHRDEDCATIQHSKCLNNECTCRNNNIPSNETTCSPILGGFCWKNEPCVTENAFCFKNECQCRANYSAIFNRCVRNVIGTDCESDGDCHQVRFAKCSAKKCQCSPNTVVVSPTYCASLLGSFCWSKDDCLTENSDCIDNKCRCRLGYVQQNINDCTPAYLRMPCNIDLDCSIAISHSICTETRHCYCEYNYRQNNENQCVPNLQLDKFCLKDDSCILKNSACIENICQCKPRFSYQHSKCLLLYLNDPCEINNDCSLIDHSECLNKVCQCSSNYTALNETFCRPLLHGICTKDQDCIVNAVCVKNKCQCRDGYFMESKDSCLAVEFRSTCRSEDDCLLILNSECFENKCQCMSGFGKYNATICAPLLNGYCSKNKLCAPKNSVCIDNVCFCREGFIMESFDKCRPYYTAISCKNNQDCGQLLNSSCVNNTCICHKDHTIVNGTICAPFLGKYCRKDQLCAAENSACINNECKCKANYLEHTEEKCLPITFSGRFEVNCSENIDCIVIKYAECRDKKCVCTQNYVALGSNKCIALIREYCESDDECIGYNTVCIDNQCRCTKKFFMRSEYRCVRMPLGRICQKSDDCTVAIKNSECSEDKICVCRKNYQAVNEFECAAQLNENCSTNEDCRIDFSVCFENKCQCNINYKFASESQCVLSESLFRCDQELDCGDPWHNKCLNNSCVCNKNNIFINKSTCSPNLGGYCWTDRQCVVRNSKCIDFRCKCRNNFIAVAANKCMSDIS